MRTAVIAAIAILTATTTVTATAATTTTTTFWCHSPQWARASSFARFLDHTRLTKVDRTPLDEGSADGRDFYLTTHNSHNRQTSMPR